MTTSRSTVIEINFENFLFFRSWFNHSRTSKELCKTRTPKKLVNDVAPAHFSRSNLKNNNRWKNSENSNEHRCTWNWKKPRRLKESNTPRHCLESGRQLNRASRRLLTLPRVGGELPNLFLLAVTGSRCRRRRRSPSHFRSTRLPPLTFDSRYVFHLGSPTRRLTSFRHASISSFHRLDFRDTTSI